MLPNFFIAGAQKAGTTALYTYLRTHPQIYLPEQKETKFFVDDTRYQKGIAHYEQEHFSSWKGEIAVGEVDPEYMYFRRALKRMKSHLDISSTKFIFILRNPIERAFSHYLMSYRRGLEPLSFEDAWNCESERIKQDYFSKLHFSYVSRGFYFKQIKRFLPYCKKSQMLFLLSEDLQKAPEDTLKKCSEFLGISTNFKFPRIEERIHQAKIPRNIKLLHRINTQGIEKKLIRFLIPWEPLRKNIRQKIISLNETSKIDMTLSYETRKKLIRLYQEENDELAHFINRDLSQWSQL